MYPRLWPCTTSTLVEPVCFPIYTGNLTKHMKSKAHSKKCMEMGVAVGVTEDHETEDSGLNISNMNSVNSMIYSRGIL